MRDAKLLINKEVLSFLEMHMEFLTKCGAIPLYTYNRDSGGNYRIHPDMKFGMPRVIHKQNRIEIFVSPEFKTLVATISRKEKVNLYEAIYLAVMELIFAPTDDV